MYILEHIYSISKVNVLLNNIWCIIKFKAKDKNKSVLVIYRTKKFTKNLLKI